MKILAIDTATEGCSVALRVDDKVYTRLTVEPRKHAELILPMIDAVLAEAQLSIQQLDALAFGRGPGAFTGVRIATGVIQGIAFGADLPVIPVSTLRALAQRTYQEYAHESVLTAFDARMNEVYWGCYQLADNGLMSLMGEEMVISPDQVNADVGMPWVASGSGFAHYTESLQTALKIDNLMMYPDLITRAEEILRLAWFDFGQGLAVSAEKALPVYLRNKVAWKKN